MPEDYDVILPEGFDPSDENFSLESFAAEEPAPTTESAPEAEPQPAVPQEEAPTTEPVPPVEQPVIPEAPQTIRVKFNHEDYELGLDEAAVWAQKGMNYDKVEQRVRDFEAKQSEYARFAKRLGYEDVDSMMAAAQQNFVRRRVKELVDAGNTEAMAQFLVKQEMAAEAAAAPTPTAPAPEEQPTPQQQSGIPGVSAEREAELREFVRAYPGVTKLPPEVIEENRKGTRLLVAYERFNNKAALNELAILKQNQAAASKAPVTGVTTQGAPGTSPEVDDPFIKGFNSAY